VVEFDDQELATHIKCYVHGAIVKRGNVYTADLKWLLEDLLIDLNDFDQVENVFIYKGVLDGTPTTIKLIFPVFRSSNTINTPFNGGQGNSILHVLCLLKDVQMRRHLSCKRLDNHLFKDKITRYFEDPGPQNTDVLIDAVKRRFRFYSHLNGPLEAYNGLRQGFNPSAKNKSTKL